MKKTDPTTAMCDFMEGLVTEVPQEEWDLVGVDESMTLDKYTYPVKNNKDINDAMATKSQQDLVRAADAALREIKLRRGQDKILLRVLMDAGARDYKAGETPVLRAIRYFQEKPK